MSLGAELLVAYLHATCGPIRSFLSWSGLGCPMLDLGSHPPHRLALRPLGGVSPGGASGACASPKSEFRGGIGQLNKSQANGATSDARSYSAGRLAVWAPPVDLTRDKATSARLAAAGVMMADACNASGPDVLWRALSPLVGIVRLRGAPIGEPTPAKPGFTLLFADDSAPSAQRDFVFLRNDLLSERVQAFATELTARRVDELDLFRDLFEGEDFVQALQYKADVSECFLNPVRVLDQPDASQLDAALGEGRLILDRNGEVSIAAPQFAAKAAAVGLAISGVGSDGREPTVHFDEPECWAVQVEQQEDSWRINASPISPPNSEVTAFEVRLAGGAGAEVSKVWVGVSRRRAKWEDWDEADARLALEESW